MINPTISPALLAAKSIKLGESISGTGTFQKTTNKGVAADNIGTFISGIITTITVVAGLAFVIYFMLGAFKWITASGDKGKVEEAQRQLTQAAIGLIVVVVSYFIVGIVGGVLGLNILDPGSIIFQMKG